MNDALVKENTVVNTMSKGTGGVIILVVIIIASVLLYGGSSTPERLHSFRSCRSH